MALFLAVLLVMALLGYYLPIDLHLHLRYDGGGLRVHLGLVTLFGLIRREREFGGAPSRERQRAESGAKEASGRDESSRSLPPNWLRRAVGAHGRYQWYGLGGTLLSYFIPDKYRPWLDVAEEFEGKGRFTRLHWRTVIGLDEAAATAWAVGILYTLKSAFLEAIGRRHRLTGRSATIVVQPWFTGRRLQTSFDCIFRLRAGYIIRGSIRGFILDKLRGSVPANDERTPDRGTHEDGDAEHQGHG